MPVPPAVAVSEVSAEPLPTAPSNVVLLPEFVVRLCAPSTVFSKVMLPAVAFRMLSLPRSTALL